jgi:hypothetical protein
MNHRVVGAWRYRLGAALLIACGTARGPGQTDSAETNQPLNPLALEWPRFFATNGFEFAVYQPQITAWPGNQLQGRFALAVRPAGTSNETYGVAFFQCRTEIDKANRLVTCEDFQVSKVNFPTQRGMQNLYQTIIKSELPQAAKVIPLDHLEATYAVSAEVAKAKIQPVNNTPPQFIYTTQPSLLVQVDGAPILKPLVPGYERVMNTRAILLLNTNMYYQGYYLFAASNWYTAPSLSGPWTVDISPPWDITTALTAAFATRQVDPAAPTAPLASPPVIYVATTPTELLQTTGTANLLSIAGTSLLYVSNTDQAIFYYLNDANYYVLISGRWFKCSSLYGPWTFVASASLPADFKKIPPDSAKSNALLSVAGTPQAQEAIIANTIPQTTTVYRDKPKLEVEYVGAPSFVAIPGTTLFYAANTATPVIMVNSTSYYACESGIWFVSSGSLGPWKVATSVPAAVYTIPTTCPVHYVTYVYVYGYTPTVVYMGYTPGYMGVIIAPGGTVVYGTGYVYPAVVVGVTYVSYPPTYGCGASFAMGAAVGFAFGYCAGHSTSCYYEPHWGCYHYTYPYHYGYAGYNVNSCSAYTHWGSSTTSYSYNRWTGTSSAYQSGSAYNPYTGTSGSYNRSASFNPYSGQASASRSGSAYNPYSGASVSGNASANANIYNGNYNAQRSASGYNPTTGRSASSSASISGNAYNGNYNASRTTSESSQYTGVSAQNTKTVSGNAYNGTASVDNSGSASNSKTGDSASWNNGTMTTDKSGNTYNYTKGDTSANQSTYQGAHSSSPSASQASYADRQASAQATGSQRYDGWSQSGGGGWGSSHSDGWGGSSASGGWGSDHSSGGWGGGGSSSWGGSHSWGGGGGGWRR